MSAAQTAHGSDGCTASFNGLACSGAPATSRMTGRTDALTSSWVSGYNQTTVTFPGSLPSFRHRAGSTCVQMRASRADVALTCPAA
jgi:hypothetical protein